ncbi:glutamate-gated chloride channel-like [Panulirus ornatus]|uniref:glutamate-gated chloride channel-like n=1 Tax=Panulirus ornatus TaxID=150431 RepID=UPI003A853BBA
MITHHRLSPCPGPAIVHINLMIRNVQTISDVKMEYSIQITFREQWVDHRLTFNNMQGRIQYLTLTETDMVWMPDLFFKNEKEGHFHKIILPNLYIRIYPNGGVLYSIRISLTLSCPMDLKLFPLDRQQCQLLMASYGWTTEDLVFLWKDVDPVQVTKNLHLPRFTLEKFITDYCNSKTNTGQAIDVWTGVCLTFVFGALLEFALVNYASRSDKHREKMKEQKKQWEAEHVAALEAAMQEQAEDGHTFAMPSSAPRPRRLMDLLIAKTKPLVSRHNGGMGTDPGRPCEIHLQPPRKNCCKTWLSKFPTRSKRIDVISRITFPLVFAFFNMAYWSTYLFTEEEEENPK